jgi:NAD-dependent SIR2 family protein deacetylase
MSQSDDAVRGFEYLEMVRGFALEPGMVDVMELGSASKGVAQSSRIPICIFISKNIDTINKSLNTHLQACHECFHPAFRRHIQIFAAPLAQRFGIDAMCNISAVPTTILVDVGRIETTDWLGIVAHEYAHAHLGISGHNQEFASILCHLCLGLGLELPIWDAETMEKSLRSWPDCKSTINPLAFWMGETSYSD